MPSEKEYIVTVKKGVNWEEVHNELTTNTAGSETIPDRIVDVVNLRNINERNTHYALTDEESAALRNDSRIAAVIDPTTRKFKKIAFQEGNFNKTYTATGEQQNWGMLRHLSTTNNYGTSTGDPGGTYDYVLDGTGVDIVVIDTGIQADHPEWQDANGVSRLQQIDWYSASGVAGSQNANHYRDYDGHGTHVTGTVAGKTFGWAKNARIYNIKLADLEGPGDTGTGIPATDVLDVLLGWHNNKAGSRPTVANASFGYQILLNANVSPNTIVDGNGDPVATITGGSYRGVPHALTTRAALSSKGLSDGQSAGNGYYIYVAYDAATDADMDQIADAGGIGAIASGNTNQKIDVFGGLDYDNYLTLSADYFGDGSFRWYYNRGGSPGFGTNPGFLVGALSNVSYSSTLDRKASFSCGGPGVNIYTAGEAVHSAMSSTYDSSAYRSIYLPQPYYLNNSFKQAKVAGTSMASPQVAGMVACLLQAHPTWTPGQVMNWFQNNAQDKMYASGVDNDYSNAYSIWGGTQRVAYFPLNGQKTFNYTAS